MKKNKQEKSFLSRAYDYVAGIAVLFFEDRVSAYAAQAALFVIISTVPFISLLLSIVGALLPNYSTDELFGSNLPEDILTLIRAVVSDMKSVPTVSLLSISAITTLWCSSRGINAIRDGIRSVYRAKPRQNYVWDRLLSLLFTLVFVAFIILLLLLILFGDFLIGKFGGALSDIIIKFRTPAFIVVLTVFFTGFFTFVAKRSDSVRHSSIYHLPGGIFSALGWMVFSHLYSLYIKYFPSASYVYGSLAAVCLIMLWLYFCMVILLAGSEINKLWFAGRETSGSNENDHAAE